MAKAVLAWAVVGAIVWIGADPVRRTFLLPELFTVVARGFALVVLPVVVAAAWRYPALGDASSPPEDRS